MVNIKFVHLVFLSLLPAFVKKPAVYGEKNFGSIYQKLGKMCYDDPKNYIEKKYEQGLYCDVEFTGTCWPQVRAGFTVLRHCPRLYFKDEALISRHCSKSGVWGIANFTSCVKLTAKEAKEVILKIAKEIHLTVDKNPVQRVENVKQHEDYERKIHVYLICSWITETALFLTLIVMSFQTSYNERVFMHRNLVFAFFMRTATFFIDYYTGISTSTSLKGVCDFFWILNRYFAVAEITWMLNDAIYLLRKIRHAFDCNPYHLYFTLWGWGFPFILTFVFYTPVMYFLNLNEKRCWTHLGQFLHSLVIYVPLTIMLIINFGIMMYTIKVLFLKMRSESYSEAKVVWKYAKGSLLLMPSVGFVYLVTFFTPNDHVQFDLFVRVLYPMQGVLVCIVHVGLNFELRQQIKRWWSSKHKATNIFIRPSLSSDQSGPSFTTQAPLYGPEEMELTELVRSPRTAQGQNIFSMSLNKVCPNITVQDEIQCEQIATQDGPSSNPHDEQLTVPLPCILGNYLSNTDDAVLIKRSHTIIEEFAKMGVKQDVYRKISTV